MSVFSVNFVKKYSLVIEIRILWGENNSATLADRS